MSTIDRLTYRLIWGVGTGSRRRFLGLTALTAGVVGAMASGLADATIAFAGKPDTCFSCCASCDPCTNACTVNGYTCTCVCNNFCQCQSTLACATSCVYGQGTCSCPTC